MDYAPLIRYASDEKYCAACLGGSYHGCHDRHEKSGSRTITGHLSGNCYHEADEEKHCPHWKTAKYHELITNP